jgi:hypothetical protein
MPSRLPAKYRRYLGLLKTDRVLWGFDQFHFAVPGSVQDHNFSFWIAKDEDVAIAEVSFLNGFFESHGTHGNCFLGAHQMNFGGPGDGGKFVDYDVD